NWTTPIVLTALGSLVYCDPRNMICRSGQVKWIKRIRIISTGPMIVLWPIIHKNFLPRQFRTNRSFQIDERKLNLATSILCGPLPASSGGNPYHPLSSNRWAFRSWRSSTGRREARCAHAAAIYRDMSLPDGTVKLVRSFIAVLSTDPGCPPPARSRLQPLPDWRPTPLISADRRAELAFVDAETSSEGEPVPAGGGLTLLLGDDAEWEETQGRSCMAGAACVEWDPARSSVRVLGSIVGLPPIYIRRIPGGVAVASELRLFRALVGLRVAVHPPAGVWLLPVRYIL